MISKCPFLLLPFCDSVIFQLISLLPCLSHLFLLSAWLQKREDTCVRSLPSSRGCSPRSRASNFKFMCQFQSNLIEVSEALTSRKAPGRRKHYTSVTTEHNSCLVWLATGQWEPVWLGARHTAYRCVLSHWKAWKGAKGMVEENVKQGKGELKTL